MDECPVIRRKIMWREGHGGGVAETQADHAGQIEGGRIETRYYHPMLSFCRERVLTDKIVLTS
jgi:hypothetical protein